MEKAVKLLSRGLCAAIAAAALVVGYFYIVLPCRISVDGDAEPTGGFAQADIRSNGESCGYYVGSIRIKNVATVERERLWLVPCGDPFGIRLHTDGVLVITVTDGSPAQRGGLKQGDIIKYVNGMSVMSNSAICSALQMNHACSELIVTRGERELRLECVPQCEDGVYKIGAWVRDSAAGIGTMTFYDPRSGTFGGLGHPVSDITTGGAVPLFRGDITEAEIFDVIKGEQGSAGELCGALRAESVTGELTANTSVGVFGVSRKVLSNRTPIPMAFRQEAQCGAATMLTTIDGSEPREYDIEIERINMYDISGSKAMVVRITDEELLEAAGGIVRGMSGSPIIQNGKLIGAVTHVLINDPTRGYAVFCESMLDALLENNAAA